jgi:Fe-Mn family superoxide dismutase
MFVLPELDYAYDAFEPVISTRTMKFHHDKHHATYVKTLNEQLDKIGKAPESVETIVRGAKNAHDRALFNNAAQVWNHTFFWKSMTPRPEKPAGRLATAIDSAFGDLVRMKKAFVKEGATHFGSGWVWLVANHQGELRIRSTHDADDTLTHTDMTPVLVCDLWEHAYYLDYQNDRRAYLEAWFDKLVNWRFAELQHSASMGEGKSWSHPLPDRDRFSKAS